MRGNHISLLRTLLGTRHRYLQDKKKSGRLRRRVRKSRREQERRKKLEGKGI